MKKALIFTAVLAAAVSLQAQGLMTFANNAATSITNAGSTVKPTSTTPIWIGLFYSTDLNAIANPETGLDSFELSSPPVSVGIFAGIFSGGTRTVTQVTGQEVLLQVRVWDKAFGSTGNSYADSIRSQDGTKMFGYSEVLRGNLGGGSLPTPALVAQFGFKGIQLDFVPVPEPSVLALGFLGAVGTLVLFRRRK